MHCSTNENLKENSIRYVEKHDTDFLNMNVNEQFDFIINDYQRQLIKYLKNAMDISRL